MSIVYFLRTCSRRARCRFLWEKDRKIQDDKLIAVAAGHGYPVADNSDNMAFPFILGGKHKVKRHLMGGMNGFSV